MTKQELDGRPLVIAFGGGTNSLAVLIGLKRLGIRPDLILFADTKGEKPETYQAVKVADQWCLKNGFSGITTVAAVSPTRGFEGLEGMVVRLDTLPSKAFGFKTCSQRYKIEPQQKFIKRWKPAVDAWAAGKKVVQVLGYDADEPQRIKEYSNAKFEHWYPLPEWGWGRDECVQAIADEGLPQPGKSACFFCPSMRKPEVIALAENNPELFSRAITMERRALAGGKIGVVKGLGRHWSWEQLVAASEAQRALIPENTMGTDCACFDGSAD